MEIIWTQYNWGKKQNKRTKDYGYCLGTPANNNIQIVPRSEYFQCLLCSVFCSVFCRFLLSENAEWDLGCVFRYIWLNTDIREMYNVDVILLSDIWLKTMIKLWKSIPKHPDLYHVYHSWRLFCADWSISFDFFLAREQMNVFIKKVFPLFDSDNC